MTIEPQHVWVPGSAAPGSGDGGRIGALPEPGKSPPSSAASQACPGRARAGSWVWYPGHGGMSPLIPPPCPGMLLAAPPASCQQNGSALSRSVKKPRQSRSQPR